MMPGWACDTVEVIRAARKASRGSTVADWENATSTSYAGCSFQFASTAADNSTASDVSSTATLYCPPSTDIANGDRVEYDGTVWNVEGHPHRWRDPFGRPSHIVAQLSRNGG